MASASRSTAPANESASPGAGVGAGAVFRARGMGTSGRVPQRNSLASMGPAWYAGVMKYEVDLPPDVDRRLSDKASQTGQDVVHLIRIAVGRFVDEEMRPARNGVWSEQLQVRRSELIDKDIADTATVADRAELIELDRLANEHFDQVAPPPFEGARRLHHQLLQNRGS